MELKTIKDELKMGMIDVKSIRLINSDFDNYYKLVKQKATEDIILNLKNQLVNTKSLPEDVKKQFTNYYELMVHKIFTHIKDAHDKVYKI